MYNRAMRSSPGHDVFSVGNMIEKMGAKTVFVDCDLVTRNIDLDQVEDKITPFTKVLVPTHFGGLPCEMDRLYDMADEYGIRVVEDAALAIGSAWKGRKIGAFLATSRPSVSIPTRT